MLYGYGKHGETYCRCKCECGNECVKESYGITHSRNPAHCGCMSKYYSEKQGERYRKDLSGERFGALTVLRMEYEAGSMSRVVCRCDCGSIISKPITYLTSGNTTSCGCVQKQRASESSTKDFTGIVSNWGVEFICRDHMDNKHKWFWKCKCGQCGSEFIALPAKILNGHTTSCGCSRRSSGEKMVENILKDMDLTYITEYPIDCGKKKKHLRLDFFLPEYNIGIEYDGKQHFEPIDYFGGEESFYDTVDRDRIKRKYCQDNNIRLLELPYTLTYDEIKENITNTIYPERLSCCN